MNVQEVMKKLGTPFTDEDVKWLPKAATVNGNGETRIKLIPYITAASVIKRLNEVLPLQWSESYQPWVINKKEGISCKITIYMENHIINVLDAGINSGENDLKGSFSDALKRTARKLGIGLDLLDYPEKWVNVLVERPKNKKYEYVSAQMKIKGSKQHIEGYYILPSITKNEEEGNRNQN